MTLDTLARGLEIHDVEFRSEYEAPFGFARGGLSSFNEFPCGMEVISIALGDVGVHQVRDDHPNVHPILGGLIRSVNDRIDDAKVRTSTLWALLPKVIDTSTRFSTWERDLYRMAVDRDMSELEYLAFHQVDINDLASTLSSDLHRRVPSLKQETDLLIYATQEYRKYTPAKAQADWTPEQYQRIADWADSRYASVSA